MLIGHVGLVPLRHRAAALTFALGPHALRVERFLVVARFFPALRLALGRLARCIGPAASRAERQSRQVLPFVSDIL